MKKEKINIGIIGLGRIGKMHTKNIHQNLPMFNLKSIADPDLDVDFIQNLDNVEFSDNTDKIISDKTIDAVVVCSALILTPFFNYNVYVFYSQC